MVLFEYWMVYLPDFNPDSFLLFDHSPDRGTTLRDYSLGIERELGNPTARSVRDATEWHRTRFPVTPHPVNAPDGRRYWALRTDEFNARYLASAQASVPSRRHLGPPEASAITMNNRGRARRGSQRQLQEYVNLQQSLLDAAIVSALPVTIQQNSPQISWVSPLAADEFREYRDAEFLAALDLERHAGDLKSFWPDRGPCWDGLAVLRTTLPRSVLVAILVEAKSHVPEMYGDGCQAGETSRALIQEAMAAAKSWCGARTDADWMGPLYQSANRIAHLYFIQRLNHPCYLVNLYFVNDPYRPTTQSEWEIALGVVHRDLGLRAAVPGLVEVFLPALPVEDELGLSARLETGPEAPEEGCSQPRRETIIPACSSAVTKAPPNGDLSFAAWCKQWELLGKFEGPVLPESDQRMQRALELWRQKVPGKWERGIDPQLLGKHYRRRDFELPHPGEHTIEHQILVERFGNVRLLDGAVLIDGVNAFPLACDFANGGRCGNVEADMLLAAQSGEGFRLVLCEVKADADNPWYAAVELLRQMRLFLTNPVGRAIMQQRGILPPSAADAPVTGMVLAPADYYRARGKKANAAAPAKELFEYMRQNLGIDARLAVWDAALNEIRDL
jgi:hypothetical protein